MLPKVRKLLCAPTSTESNLAVVHVALSPIHEALETIFKLWIVEVGIRVIWIKPGTTKVAKVCLALSACNVITSIRFLARHRAIWTWCCVPCNEVE